MKPTDNPIWVVGRQHSGNTVTTAILGRHPGVHAYLNEDKFFEHLPLFAVPPRASDRKRLLSLLKTSQLPPLTGHDLQELEVWLADRQESQPCEPPATLYAAAKSHTAQRFGAQRWAQKATSYVFHAEDVFTALPSSVMIFLLRNPLDIAASLRIRSQPSRWLRMCMGWRRGVRLALDLRKTYSGQFTIVRYEDLVTDPQATVKDLFDFCDLTFTEEVLEVAHVNPAEAPYSTSGPPKGLKSNKLFYYTNHLSAADTQFIVEQSGRDLLTTLYPELSDALVQPSIRSRIFTSRHLLSGTMDMLLDVSRRLLRNPSLTISRFRRRIRP